MGSNPFTDTHSGGKSPYKASNTKAYLEQWQPVFAIDEPKCQACPLWETSFSGGVRRSAVYGRGSGKNGLYIIGEGLGAREVIMGLPFVGDAGELQTRILQEVGIYEPDCFISNAVRCRPPENRAPTAEEMKICGEHHLMKDMPTYPPKVVVLAGNSALKAVLGMQKITERRGIWYDGMYAGHKVKILPTFHPANVLRKPALYDTVKADFQKVKETLIAMQTPDAPVISTLPKLKREYINSKERFLEWMKLLANFPELPITNDTESTGLVFFRDKITANSFVFELDGEWYGIAFLTQPGVKRIDKNPKWNEAGDEQIGWDYVKVYYSKEEWWWADLYDPEVKAALAPVLARDIGIDFQNSDHDVKFWWYHGYRTKCRIDTLDEHLMMDENSLHGLKFLVTRYLMEGGGYQQEIYDLVGDKGHLSDAPPEMLLKYCMDDTFYTGVLERYKFTPQVKAEGIWPFFTGHAMPLRRALTRVAYRGILVDRDRVIDRSGSNRQKGKLKEEELFDLVHQRFNYASTIQLVKVLYKDLGLPIIKRTEKGAPSTDKETLSTLAQQHPAPKIIDEIRHIRKNLSTYLDGKSWPDDKGEIKDTGGILQYLDDNNRFHTDLKTQGTISGRLAASILLNVPRDPDIRMNFMAPPGWKFIDKDYSQAELVLLAYLSQDPGFIAAVNSSDLHQATLDDLIKSSPIIADRLKGMSPKDLRNMAKSVNFRRAYRGGPEELANQLGYDLEVTQTWYAKLDQLYPMIPLWWQTKERQWRDYHYDDGIYGRRKHFPPALNAQIEAYYDRLSANFPCQNGVADTTNRSIFLFEQAIDDIFGWDLDKVYQIPGIVLPVHDNIIAEAPDELVPEMDDLLTKVMTLPLPKLGISLRVDTVIEQRWGQTEYEKQLVREEKPKIDENLDRIQH